MSLQENGELTPSRQRQLAALTPAWAPGQSGNPAGRPRSARSKITESFFKDFYERWEQHGKKALLEAAEKNPVEFVRIAVALLPKEVHITELPLEDVTEDELIGFVESLRASKARCIGAEASPRTSAAKRKAKP